MTAARYCLNHYICPPGLGLLDFLDLAVAHGFVGVGLTERALQELDTVRLAEALRERGLSISSVNSAGYFLYGDAERARQQAERNRWLIDCCALLGGAPLNVIVGGLGHTDGTLRLAAARQRAHEQWLGFAGQAAAAGVPLLFEPIHPLGMWLKGCVHSLQESEEFVRGVPGAAITLDCFHSWWDAALPDFLARDDSPLALVQICDVAAMGEDSIPQRVPPGEGVLDLGPLLRDCLRRRLPPCLELELFAAQLKGRDLGDVLKRACRHLADIERAII
ncbi:MAG: sugar phosphate isomerase/epimerase family protein [Burkholderiaceae bacterium]